MKRGLAAELSGQPSPGRCGSSELLPNSIRRWGVVSHGRGWRISKETVITMAAVPGRAGGAAGEREGPKQVLIDVPRSRNRRLEPWNDEPRQAFSFVHRPRPPGTSSRLDLRHAERLGPAAELMGQGVGIESGP